MRYLLCSKWYNIGAFYSYHSLSNKRTWFILKLIGYGMIYRVSLVVGRNKEFLASAAKRGAAILCAHTCSQGSDMWILSTSVPPPPPTSSFSAVTVKPSWNWRRFARWLERGRAANSLRSSSWVQYSIVLGVTLPFRSFWCLGKISLTLQS